MWKPVFWRFHVFPPVAWLHSPLSAEKLKTVLIKTKFSVIKLKNSTAFLNSWKVVIWGNKRLLSDNYELNTQCLHMFHFENAEPNAVNGEPEKMHSFERYHKISIFWYEFVIFRQQVIGTGGGAQILEPLKKTSWLRLFFHSATCLWI